MRSAPLLLVLAAAASLVAIAPPAHAKKDKEDAAQQDFSAAYASEDAAERSKAVAALRKGKDAVKFQLVTDLVLPKEKRADVVATAIDVLSSITDEAIIAKIADGAVKKGKMDVRIAYLEALGAFKSDVAYEALVAAAQDKEPFVRGMAAFGLGRHRRIDALDTLMALIEDPAWQVQATALASLPRLDGKSRLEAKVGKLVEIMESASGRLRDDFGDALERITGKNYGRDVDKWRLHAEGRDVPPDQPAEGEDGEATAGYGFEKPHFYGMEVTSERVVLLLDMSLSMTEPIQVDLERLRRETSRRRAITGAKDEPKNDKGEPDEFDIPWWRVKTNLDLARYQTINLIEKLRPEQNFELIVFSTEVHPWMGRLVPATPANKLKAQRMIEELEPDDKTNTWGALSAAFDLYDNQKRSYDKGPDAVYMVTDGAPSVGDITDLDQIEAAVMQLWKIKQIRINIIGIGVNLRALRRICTKTGGKAKFFD